MPAAGYSPIDFLVAENILVKSVFRLIRINEWILNYLQNWFTIIVGHYNKYVIEIWCYLTYLCKRYQSTFLVPCGLIIQMISVEATRSAGNHKILSLFVRVEGNLLSWKKKSFSAIYFVSFILINLFTLKANKKL